MVCCFSQNRIGASKQIRNESKQNHTKSPKDIEDVHVLLWFRNVLCKLIEKEVCQELFNTNATFGIRNSGAEVIPDGWEVLEKYCHETVLLLDV